MTGLCHACRRSLDLTETEFDAARVRLSERARTLGIDLAGKIREANAARILDKKPETLRDWRKGLEPDVAPVRFYRDGTGHVYYLIEDLAAFDIGLTN